MNLRCKLILWNFVTLITFITGCVKNDMDSCTPEEIKGTEGLELYFYSQTICQRDTLYPEDINNITFGIFDKNGLLRAHSSLTNIRLNNNFTQKIEVSSGLYTVIAWSGINDTAFDLTMLQDSITTKSDLLYRLKRLDDQAYSLEGVTIYYGESPAVYVPENSSSESSFERTGINMQELTNRLTVTVDGLDDDYEYEIFIESGNGSMNIDGTMTEDIVLEYMGIDASMDTTLIFNFTLLPLQTGITNTLVIRNITEDIELFRENLLGTLLLKNPEINLACDHDFTINFTAEDQCDCGTYIITEIWVNNWLVHSYETEM